ncbi:MAG: hypothetical protein QM831_32510 [Kofleriaceae bacterium]
MADRDLQTGNQTGRAQAAPQVAPAAAPGVTALQSKLSQGSPQPEQIAELLSQFPHDRDAMLEELQQKLGNGFTQQVVDAEANGGKVGWWSKFKRGAGASATIAAELAGMGLSFNPFTGNAHGTVDLASALHVAEMIAPNSIPVIMLGGVPKSANKITVQFNLYSMEATLVAPQLQIGGVMTGGLNAGACSITGLTAHVDKAGASATMQHAHFEHATFIRGGEHLTAADLEMTNLRANQAGSKSAIAFGSAHIHGLQYPNVPAVDFDLPAGASLDAVWAHGPAHTATPTPANANAGLPQAPDVLPNGAQIKIELVAPKGTVNGATGAGGFERLKAAVVQGATDLASIEIDGFTAAGGAANASASIRQILIHGDPSLVKQLLAHPQVAGNPSVKAALDLAKSSGLDPAIGGRIVAHNITANHTASGDEVTGDFDGTIEVPQLGTLQVKVDGLAGGAQGLTQVQVQFKTLSLTLRDKANKELAFLELDGGSASMAGDKRAGQVKKLAAHGDVAKLVGASDAIVKHAPVDIRGALNAVKALGLKGDITGDLSATSDANGVSFAGDFDAALAMDAAGSVKIHVAGMKGNDKGDIDFSSFTASLTDTKGHPAASLSVANAHSTPAAKGKENVHVGKIQAHGEDATVAAMVNSIEKKATTLPDPVRAAFTMVHRFYANAGGTLTLDQIAMGEDKAGATTMKAQDVHGVFTLHGAGTATVALNGFNGTSSTTQDKFSFTSFDAVLNDVHGKKAAHVRVEGSHDSFATKGKAAGDFKLDAKSMHVDGDSEAAAALFTGIRTHLDTMPKPIAAAFKMVEQYAGSISATGTIDVANAAVTSTNGAIGGKGTIEGHVQIADGRVDAKLVNAQGDKDKLTFDALDLSLKDKQGKVAASLHAANANANIAAKTAQLGQIQVHGEAAKLKPLLTPAIQAQLPAQLGQVLAMVDGSALDVNATDVAVGPTRAGAKTITASGTIRVHDQGNHVYTARGAQLELDGADIQMDQQGKPHEIDAQSIQIRGEFSSTGGDALHGHAVVTTGAAKIVLDATGAPVSVDVKGIRASGDGQRTAAPAAATSNAPQHKPTRDEKLAALNGEMATAESVAQSIQTADIRAHVPLFAGRYGRGFKSLGVPAGAAINIAIEVRNNALTNETSVKIAPPLDLPLWLTGKGVDLETKGRQGALELRLGGFFDQNITKYVVGKGPLSLDLPGLVEQVAGHMRQGILEAGDDKEPSARDQQKAARQAADDDNWMSREHADWQKDHDRDAARGDQKRLAKDAGKEPRSANIADFATKGIDVAKTQATADVAFAKPDGTVSGHVHGSATGGGRLHLTADALNARTAEGNVAVTGLDTGVVNVAPDASSIELQGLSISEFKYSK